MHIEVQGQAEKGFAERMFIYHYRLFDRYKKPLTSLALLIDENSNWRPSHYEHRLWGCQLRFDFVAIKLLDYELQRAPLLESINPFALVILAHLDALKTKDNEQQRL